MPQTLVAGLLVLQDEAAPLVLQIKWTKTKIQHVGEPHLTQSTVQVAAENIDLVNNFVYLGSLISHDSSALESQGTVSPVLKRIFGGLTYVQMPRCSSTGVLVLYSASPALWMQDKDSH